MGADLGKILVGDLGGDLLHVVLGRPLPPVPRVGTKEGEVRAGVASPSPFSTSVYLGGEGLELCATRFLVNGVSPAACTTSTVLDDGVVPGGMRIHMGGGERV